MNDRSERWARRFEWPILVAALLVVPVIAIEQSSLGEPWRTAAGILNWTIWIAFAVELATLLAVAPDRWRWLREHPLEVAVVVLTPPFLPSSLQAARVFRLLRLLRLARLFQLLRRLFTFEGLRYAALLAGMTALGGGAAFAAVENRSTWDGFYWAVTTMTTVGYGDLSPQTSGGKAIAMTVMVVGIGFLSLLIGAVAERFVAPGIRSEAAEVEDEVASAEADVLREIKEIAQRLKRLESSVQRLSQQER